MSEQFFNDTNQEYISSRDAARVYDVTHDYISRLCRKGKLNGVLNGRKWLVDKKSLETFFASRTGTAVYKPLANEEYISSKEAAKMYRVSNDYIARLCKQGKLSGTLKDRSWLVQRSSLAAFFVTRTAYVPKKDAALPVVQSVPVYHLPPNSTAASATVRATSFTQKKVLPHFDTQKVFAYAGAVVALMFLFSFGAYAMSRPTVTSTGGVASAWSGFMSAVGGLHDLFFGTTVPPVATAPTKAVATPAPVVAVATPVAAPQATTTLQNIIEQKTYPVTERTVEHTVTVSGVTEDELATKISEANNALRSEVFAQLNTVSTPYSGGGFTNNLALAQRIDQLSDVTITNATVHGVSGLTAADIPALNYIASNGTLAVANGGTGTTTVPTYGQLLVGNNLGGYDLVSTSSLSIAGGGATGFGYLFPGNATSTPLAFNGGASISALTLGTALSVINGGTGTSTAPQYGKLLLGNVSGGYDLVSTSSLGIAVSGPSATFGTTSISAIGPLVWNTSTAQLSITQSGPTTDGYLSSANFTNFTNKISSTSLSAIYPLAYNSNTGVFTNAFSTTTANTYAQLQTFTGGISINAATTTSFAITNVPSGLLKTLSNGAVVAAVAGTDYLTTANILAFPFTPTTYGSTSANATSTLIGFTNGFYAQGSSTITGTLTVSNLQVQNGSGTSTIVGNIALAGSIIPTVDNTYSLGSNAYRWKDLYVGPGSIYVNGQEVIHTDPSNNVIIGSDPNQDFEVYTTGTANIQLNPSGTGQVLVKSNINLTSGKQIVTSDGSAVLLPNGAAAGNLTINANAITATNLNGGISLTPAGNGGTYITNGNFGIGTTSPTNKLEVNGSSYLAGNTILTNATTSSFAIAGITSTLLKTLSNGAVVAAVAGVDYDPAGAAASAAAGAFSFTPDTTFAASANSTSTLIGFTNGLYALASSTIGSGNQNGGLTIYGGATTTGNAYFAGNIGVGTTSPYAQLTVATPAIATGSQLNLFAIASSTSGTATTTLFTVTNAGNVGIGIATPSFPLHVVGNSASGPITAMIQNLSGNSNGRGDVQLFLGTRSTPGDTNVGASIYADRTDTVIGGDTDLLFKNSSGTVLNTNMVIKANGNVGVGSTTPSAKLDVAGNINIGTGFGYQIGDQTVLYATSTGFDTFGGIGAGAGVIANGTSSNLTSAPNSTAFGYNALSASTITGYSNSAFGYQALKVDTSGFQNSAFGQNALSNNLGGSNNSAFGQTALNGNTTGNFNVGMGLSALASNQTGSGNTGIGYQAGSGVSSNSFSNNALFGYKTGGALSTGSQNIFLGASTGSTTATGNNNIALGYDIALPVTNGSNQLNIGNLLFGTGINGEGTNLSTGNIGVGTTTPWAKLSIDTTSLAAGVAEFVVGSSSRSDFAITQNGYVGIGLANPTDLLTINTNNTALTFGNVNGSTIRTGSGGGLVINAPTNGSLYFNRDATGVDYHFQESGSVEPFTILHGGNVGIGTTSPYAQLTVATPSIATGSQLNLFAIASSTNGTATSTLFSVSNTGLATLTNLFALGSSTIGSGTQAGGLTINGGATTTGNLSLPFGSATNPSVSFGDTGTGFYRQSNQVIGYTQNGINWWQFSGASFKSASNFGPSLFSSTGISVSIPNIIPDQNVGNTGFAAGAAGNINAIVGGQEVSRWTATGFGLGTSSPYAQLSILATSTSGLGSPTTLFAIASTTAGTATSTLFNISNTGLVTIQQGATPTGTQNVFAIAHSNGTQGLTYALDSNQHYYLTGYDPNGSTIRFSNSSYYSTGINPVNYATSGGLGIGGGIAYNYNNGGFGISVLNPSANGAAYFNGKTSVGSTSPFALLSVQANSADTNQILFAIGSSTASATTTLFTVTNTGNVGVGTSSPIGTLAIGSGQLVVQPGSVSVPSIAFSNSLNTGIYGNVAGGLNITTNGNQVFRSIGNVSYFGNSLTIGTLATVGPSQGLYVVGSTGIGTSSPFAKFAINANSGDTNQFLLAIGSSTTSGTTTLFTIDNTGNVTINGSSGSTCTLGNGSGGTSCTSDARLKTNITPISGTDALAKFAFVQGVTFNWADPTKNQQQYVGVIAQAVQHAFPQVVSTTTSGFLSVDYSSLVGPLISAVNQLNVRTQGLADASSTLQISAATINYVNPATTTVAVGTNVWTIATSSATGTTPIIAISAPASSTPSVSINGELYLNGQDIGAAVASSSATTTTTQITTVTFANASSGLLNALTSAFASFAGLAQGGVRELGLAVHASLGVFDKVFAGEVHTDKLCVGDTCVSQSQFLQMVQTASAQSSQTSQSASTPTDASSTPDTSTNTPVTPDTMAATPASPDGGSTGQAEQ